MDRTPPTDAERDHVAHGREGHGDHDVRPNEEVNITAEECAGSQEERDRETARNLEFDEADILLVLATEQDGAETRSIGGLPVSSARDSGDDEADSNEERDPRVLHRSEYEDSDVGRQVASEGEEEDISNAALEEFMSLLLEPPVPIWSPAITVPGQKKDSKLFLDERTSYVYRFKSKDRKYNRVYLTCRHKHCRASAILIREKDAEIGDAIRQTSHHDHDPDPDYRDAKEFRGILYHRAQTESKPCKEIYMEEAIK